jgi:hypothetical protein
MQLMERIDKLMDIRTLNDWSRGFLESVKEQLGKRGKLSEKQIAIITKIESENTDEEIQSREDWVANYDDEKREIAKICANYYLRGGQYFQGLSYKVINEDDFIPSEKQWRKICDNKYVKKVLAATFDKPVFPEGSMVSLRTSAPYRAKIASPQGIFLVVKPNAKPVISACKGAKIYELLPVGSINTVLVEERHIKKMKKVE